MAVVYELHHTMSYIVLDASAEDVCASHHPLHTRLELEATSSS